MSNMNQRAPARKSDLAFIDGIFKEPDNPHRFQNDFNGSPPAKIIDEEPKGEDHGSAELLRIGEHDERPLWKRFPILSEEEERDLVSRWRTDPKAKDRLVLSHARLIHKIVRRHQRLGSLASNDEAYADGIAAGNGGFLRALERFDPNAGYRLMTFAWKWVEGEILKFARENASIIKTPQGQDQYNDVSMSHAPYKGGSDNLGIRDTALGDTLPDTAPSPLEVILKEKEFERQKSILVRALRVLTRREYRVYHARRLSTPPIRLRVLARQLGISSERVRQIEYAAVKKVTAQLGELKGHVGNRPIPAPSPQLSWLDPKRLIKSYIDKGFSEETARALARQRSAHTEAALGLPGSHDKYWKKPPSKVWRQFLSLPAGKRMSEACK
jgi:RNA polymerase sigma-32 factor